MKIFMKRLIFLTYSIVSMIVLMIAIIYPFVLSFDDSPPSWTCWILYPITLIIMASQSQVLKWGDVVMNDNCT